MQLRVYQWSRRHSANTPCDSTSSWSSDQSHIRQSVPSTHTTPHRHMRSHTLHITHTHTHAHPFNGHLSGTTQVSRYQKGKANLDFTEARDSEWQWHQPGHMQVCTSLQTDRFSHVCRAHNRDSCDQHTDRHRHTDRPRQCVCRNRPHLCMRQLVAWHSGRTSVSGRRTFPVLRSTCSWWVTTNVGKPSATGQPTRPTQPFILSGSINE